MRFVLGSYVAHRGEKINACGNVRGKPTGNKLFGRTRRK